MSHPLEQRVAAVRRTARRLWLAFGAGRFAAVLLGGVLLAGLADYWLHFRDPGIRVIVSLVVLCLCGWAAYRYLLAALRRRLTDVEVARRIERRFPQLSDRLSSTINFLTQPEDDPAAGSAAMRRAAITQTAVEAESLNFSDAIEKRPAVRAVSVAAGLALVALLLTAIDPASARLAVARLMKPWGREAWPKVHELEFVNPPQWVASGQPFQVELQDRHGSLPDAVRIHYRLRQPDGTTGEESAPMQLLGRVAVAQRDNVTRPFEYRAEGGDDDAMEWTALEVVEPPRVQSLKITLTPPPYTGWPAESSDRRIRALRGTQVQMTGTTTKPLASAKLKLDDGDDHGAEVVTRLSDDGLHFAIPAAEDQPLSIDKSGAYWFELVDHNGVVGGAEARWEIRAVPDQPPSVSIEQPTANLFLTPEAMVPLKVVVKDDLAIRNVALHFSRTDRSDQGDFSAPLYAGPEKVEPISAAARASATEQGESRTVEYRWELAPLGLKPGTQIAMYATADDYSPQTGQSMPRQLTIVTPKELSDRLAQREEFILGELARVLKMQQDVRRQTSDLEIQLNEVGKFTQPDQDRLQGAGLSQRQVARSLTSPTEGIVSHVELLLADLQSNRVDSPDLERRMRGVLAEIGRLNLGLLPGIERELTAAVKGALSQPPQWPALGGSLASAGSQQDQVIEALERLLGDLGQAENYRRFAREIETLRREQESLLQETPKLGQGSFTRDARDLDAQQQADLKKLAQRQVDLARRFDRVQQQMEQATTQLRDSDPMASDTLDDAAGSARRGNVSREMRDSSQQLEQNQTERARALEQHVGQTLQEMLDILANRREQELSRLVKQLRQAEQRLAELRAQQEGLQKQTQKAAKIADEAQRRRELERLSREQKQLQAEAERFARQLQRLQADRAARAAAQAGSQMGQAGQAEQDGNGAQAEQNAAGAKRDLDEAQQQLAARRKQAEQDLAQEELARIETALKSLHERQQALIGETSRLDALRDPQGRFSRAQAQSVQDLTRNQDVLRDETLGLAKKITAAEVFSSALDGAAADMAQAVESLDRRETGRPAQQAQQHALVRLAQLLEAMMPDKSDNGKDGGGGGSGGGGGKSGAPRDLAEIKLLKLMQQDVNRRTEELQRSMKPLERLADDQKQELVRLALDQRRLAELIRNLSQPAEAEPENDLEKLPDLRLDEKPQ